MPNAGKRQKKKTGHCSHAHTCSSPKVSRSLICLQANNKSGSVYFSQRKARVSFLRWTMFPPANLVADTNKKTGLTWLRLRCTLVSWVIVFLSRFELFGVYPSLKNHQLCTYVNAIVVLVTLKSIGYTCALKHIYSSVFPEFLIGTV